jgi:hypothetical protein
MNVFADQKRRLKPQQPNLPGTRIAGTVLLVSLLAGSGLVGWQTVDNARSARVAASAEGRALAAAIELQLQQAASAVETLAAVAKQTGGSIPNFQAMATALLSTRSGIASLELQPGGVVKEIVPRPGNERALGINVLNDPLQRGAVNAAIQRLAPVIVGPAKLHTGEPGIIARAALYQKGRDGRDSLVGFVAANVRIKDLAAHAHLDALWNRGYSYSLFVPSAPNRNAVGLLLRGEVSLGSAVQQPLKVHNLQLSLALEPQHGWINMTRLGLEVLLMLLACLVIWVGARLLESKRAMSLELVELQQRAEHESRERARAEEDSRTAAQILATREPDLKQSQAALQQAQALHAEAVAQLENKLQRAEQGREAAQSRAQAAERSVSELADQLAAANRAGQEAARAHGAAQEQIQARLKKANEQAAEFQRRFEEAGRAHKEALADSLKQAAAEQHTISDLKARMESLEKSSRRTEQQQTERIRDLEQRNRELTARLQTTASTENQVAKEAAFPMESPAPAETEETEFSGPAKPADVETPPELEAEVTGDDMPEAPATQGQPEAGVPQPLDAPGAEATAPQSLPDTRPSGEEPAAAEAIPVPAPANEGTAAATRPTKGARRKKTRRDAQMDLFGGTTAADEDFERPAVVAVDKEVLQAWPIDPESESPEVTALDAQLAPEDGEQAIASGEPKDSGDLPVIKGISGSEGLGWADGNTALFIKALREFCQHQNGMGDKIRAALEQGDAAAAEQLARGLKNSAAEIGAATLAESAIGLARAIHDRAEPAELEAAWSEVESQLHDLLVELKAVTKPKGEKPAPTRRLPAPPPLDVAQLRKAVNLILPLLVDGDPGAKDCLKDNRNTFRSGFNPEVYADFEQMVKKGNFGEALESLRKAARKHGIAV